MIFAFNGFAQSDLDTFTTLNGLPKFTPTVVGNQLPEPYGETTMDLEVAHAIAPDAQMVVVNARPTVEGDGAFQKIGQMLEDTDRQFPGAIWSLSIGWGCDKLLTAADLAPVRSALAAAHARGTTAFNASGDLAGLECKGGDDWDSPPGPSDVGLDSIASLPEMTSVGGTTLSTDAQGDWLAEQAWFDVPLSQGTGGGVSTLFDMPAVAAGRGRTGSRRPQYGQAADPGHLRRRRPVHRGEDRAQRRQRGRRRNLAVGTDLGGPGRGDDAVPARPTAAARSVTSTPCCTGWPRAHHCPPSATSTLGGNAVDTAGPGYDLVSGLGTPDVDNLARNLLTPAEGHPMSTEPEPPTARRQAWSSAGCAGYRYPTANTAASAGFQSGRWGDRGGPQIGCA